MCKLDYRSHLGQGSPSSTGRPTKKIFRLIDIKSGFGRLANLARVEVEDGAHVQNGPQKNVTGILLLPV